MYNLKSNCLKWKKGLIVMYLLFIFFIVGAFIIC